MRYGAILLPGIVTPAELFFAELGPALDNATAVPHPLAVYAGKTVPPPGYTGFDSEIASVIADADERGFERFHLAGYSFGGGVAVATVARHKDRIASLTLMEPAWLGNEGELPEELQARKEIDAILALPQEELMPAFVRFNLAPGVTPPPPRTEIPNWMATRPAGIATTNKTFNAHHLDLEALASFDRPVLYVLGGLSNPALYRSKLERCRNLFPDFSAEIFPNRHHFDPPHRTEPDRLANVLKAHWQRAESNMLPA